MKEQVSVLVVAPNDDLHAQAVIDALVRRHVSVEWVDLAMLNKTARLTLSLENAADAYLLI